MREVIKRLGVLVLLQGACLATGLWIHDRLLISSAKWSSAARPVARLGQTNSLPHRADEAKSVGLSGSTTPSTWSGATDSGATATAQDEVRRLFDAMPAASLIAFIWTLGLQSVIAGVLLSRLHREHSRRQSTSDQQTWQHTQDLLQTRDAVIFGLAQLAESRDPETGHHLQRISMYSTRLAAALSRDPQYRDVVTPAFLRLIGISSALHDIGKVGLEDSVLLKPGALTSPERFRMQLHAEVGADCIREIERRLGTSNFLEMAREIAYSHHERWDGTGYPAGLSGTNIPLAARIVAIADVYDALSVRRAYKDPFPHADCVTIIREEAGNHFDPDLVSIFLRIESQFQEIACRFADEASLRERESQANPPRESEQRFSPQQHALLAALSQVDETPQPLETVAGESLACAEPRGRSHGADLVDLSAGNPNIV